MRAFLFFTALFFSANVFCQTSIIGKWKPVSYDMGSLMKADVITGQITLSDSLKIKFKDDKDPEGSAKMMEGLGSIMLEKMKNAQEEYLADGTWTETNIENGKVRTGKYNFIQESGLLTREGRKEEKFVVIFKDNKMIFTSDLESKDGHKGKLVLVYTKL